MRQKRDQNYIPKRIALCHPPFQLSYVCSYVVPIENRVRETRDQTLSRTTPLDSTEPLSAATHVRCTTSQNLRQRLHRATGSCRNGSPEFPSPKSTCHRRHKAVCRQLPPHASSPRNRLTILLRHHSTEPHHSTSGDCTCIILARTCGER